MSAISFGACAYVLDKYCLLPNGASMGDGYGPMVIADAKAWRHPPGRPRRGTRRAVIEWLKGRKIAVPGLKTSAFLIAAALHGRTSTTSWCRSTRFLTPCRTGEADAGLIIHEGQLTYARDGFTKIVDLGEWWKNKTGLPLPLGGNVVRKDLDPEVRRELSQIMRESIDYGLAHRADDRRAFDAAGARLRRAVGRPVHRDVRQRLYPRLWRQRVAGQSQEFLGAASERGFIPAPVELEFVEVGPPARDRSVMHRDASSEEPPCQCRIPVDLAVARVRHVLDTEERAEVFVDRVAAQEPEVRVAAQVDVLRVAFRVERHVLASVDDLRFQGCG